MWPRPRESLPSSSNRQRHQTTTRPAAEVHANTAMRRSRRKPAELWKAALRSRRDCCSWSGSCEHITRSSSPRVPAQEWPKYLASEICPSSSRRAQRQEAQAVWRRWRWQRRMRGRLRSLRWPLIRLAAPRSRLVCRQRSAASARQIWDAPVRSQYRPRRQRKRLLTLQQRMRRCRGWWPQGWSTADQRKCCRASISRGQCHPLRPRARPPRPPRYPCPCLPPSHLLGGSSRRRRTMAAAATLPLVGEAVH